MRGSDWKPLLFSFALRELSDVHAILCDVATNGTENLFGAWRHHRRRIVSGLSTSLRGMILGGLCLLRFL